MSYCFIVASSDDRINCLIKCAQKIKANQYYSNADVYLYYQGTNVNAVKSIGLFRDVVFDDRLRGVFTPRFELLKKYGCKYDFVVIIDDDLYMYTDTTYQTCFDLLNEVETAGCCCIVTHKSKRKILLENVSAKMGYYNVDGGLVLPKRAVRLILDYFSGKEMDYTEDMFWLLLYVKGYDLFRDHSSNAVHICNTKGDKGQFTGFSKMRTEQEHLPILSEWFDAKFGFEPRYEKCLYKIKELKDINANGIAERRKNYGKTAKRD